MFPSNVEFFVREKEAERQVEIEQIRLGRLSRRRSGASRRRLAHLLYWLGTRLVAWAEKLQVQPVSASTPTPTTEHTLP